MPAQKKIDAVESLRASIERAAITIAADYRGLSVGEMSALRHAVRAAGVDVKIVKNRLFLRAAQAAGRPELAELLEGPTAIVFGYEDVAGPAKAVTEYMRTARNMFAVRKGAMDGQLLSLADLQDLASLPPRSVLLAQVAGTLQAPVTRLAVLLNNLIVNAPGRLLNDTVRTFAGLLDARAKQLEGA